MNILDTCTFLWLCAEPNRLSRKAADGIKEADQNVFSHVSFMEICMKWSAGKLVLPEPPRVWISSQLKTWGFDILPLTDDDFFRICELEMMHRDPFDRLLVAQAMRTGSAIITPDPTIAKYPVKVVW